MTIHWKAVRQYFNCGTVCDFEKYSFGFGTVRSERVNDTKELLYLQRIPFQNMVKEGLSKLNCH